MSDHKRLPGIPPAIGTLDAFIEALQTIDPAGATHANIPGASSLAPGEARLAIRMILDAFEDAGEAFECEGRRGARAWLQDRSALYSARLCIEALGGDYDAIRSELVKRWALADTKPKGEA